MFIHDRNHRNISKDSSPLSSSSSSLVLNNNSNNNNNNNSDDLKKDYKIQQLIAKKRQFDQTLTNLCHQLTQMVNDIESLRQFNNQLYQDNLNQIKLEQQQQQRRDNQHKPILLSTAVDIVDHQQQLTTTEKPTSSVSTLFSPTFSSPSSRTPSPRPESSVSFTFCSEMATINSAISSFSTTTTTSSGGASNINYEIDHLTLTEIDELPLYQLDYFINFIYETSLNNNKQIEEDFTTNFEQLYIALLSSDFISDSNEFYNNSAATISVDNTLQFDSPILESTTDEQSVEINSFVDAFSEPFRSVAVESCNGEEENYHIHQSSSSSIEGNDKDRDCTASKMEFVLIENSTVYTKLDEEDKKSVSSYLSSSREEECSTTTSSIYEDTIDVEQISEGEDEQEMEVEEKEEIGITKMEENEEEEDNPSLDIDVIISEHNFPMIDSPLNNNNVDTTIKTMVFSPSNSSSAVWSVCTSPSSFTSSSSKDVIINNSSDVIDDDNEDEEHDNENNKNKDKNPNNHNNNNNINPTINRVIRGLNRSSSFNTSQHFTQLTTTPELEVDKNVKEDETSLLFIDRKMVKIKGYDEKTGKETFEQVVLKPVRRAETFASTRGSRPQLTYNITNNNENINSPTQKQENTENMTFASRRNMWERRSLAPGHKFRVTQ